MNHSSPHTSRATSSESITQIYTTEQVSPNIRHSTHFSTEASDVSKSTYSPSTTTTEEETSIASSSTIRPHATSSERVTQIKTTEYVSQVSSHPLHSTVIHFTEGSSSIKPSEPFFTTRTQPSSFRTETPSFSRLTAFPSVTHSSHLVSTTESRASHRPTQNTPEASSRPIKRMYQPEK
nr:PREDICTED: mucin-3A-like [Lepisosteus oculatus]